MYDEPKAGMEELSKRDLMAMAALQGLLAGPVNVSASKIAGYSYQIADDMLTESAKPWDGKSIAQRMDLSGHAEA